MATAGEITEVRENTNEPTSVDFTDERIGDFVDDLASVNLASAKVWEKKAAAYADLANVTEAGARREMEALYDHAIKQAAYWKSKHGDTLPEADVKGRAKVHIIARTV